jgi:polar amino acid transport system ATP-binding protein
VSTAATVPLVRLRHLGKRFGEVEVLRGIDLDVPEGQVVGIIGPSGSGKSTLLRILMALEHPDEGRVEIAGESLFTVRRDGHERPAGRAHIRRVCRSIGMVFQQFNLFPHMTALQNVMEAPVSVLGLARPDARQQATAYLARVGLGDKLSAYPRELSGGQKQRVAIARALAMRPRLMLFDEITSALDPELVGGILDLLAELSAAHEMTMLIVTHEMSFARSSADRVLFFDRGLIVEDGDPATVFTAPTHPRTREFLKRELSG